MPAISKLTDDLVATIHARKAADPALSNKALAAELNLDRRLIEKAMLMVKTTPAEGAGELRWLDHAQIVRSALNPRKTFDQAELEETAESIAAVGVLQSLLVREGTDGNFILISGERRHRAIGLLIEQNRWNEKIPVRVVQADEATHLVLAMVENLQREGVPPLEEADAFVQLQNIDPETWTAQAIADKIGKTKRFVYQRMALAKKLAPEAREALANGRITIEAARMLVTVDAERQAEILDCDSPNTKIPTVDIAYEVTGDLMLVEDAIFDVETCELETVEMSGDLYFVDAKAAYEAQLAAVKAKAKELKKSWAFVEVLPVGTYFHGYEWLTNKTKAEGGGVVIQMLKGNNAVTIHEGVVKKPIAEQQPTVPFDRDAAAAKYEAERAQRQAELEAREAAQTALYDSLLIEKPGDYAEDHLFTEADKTCQNGCIHRVLLAYSAPRDYHLCINPKSPRAGLLTFETQAGRECFDIGEGK